MKILCLDTNHPLLIETLLKNGFLVEEEYLSTYSEIVSIIDDYDGIILRSRIPLDKNLISKAKSLKFIARVGAGMENIDTEFALQKNIKLFNAPEGNRDSVAEHCVAMLLNLLHRIRIADNEVRNNTWKRAENRGDELMGKTIGIYGYGTMGKAFAKRLLGFGVKVICCDILENIGDEFAQQVSEENLMNESDVISIHVPLTEKTNQYFNAYFFENCKKNIYFINTSRGKCVNTEDLIIALENRKIKGACLDVLEFEQSSFEKINTNKTLQYLQQSDKVILTPHIAGWSLQSNEKMARMIAEKIIKEFL